MHPTRRRLCEGCPKAVGLATDSPVLRRNSEKEFAKREIASLRSAGAKKNLTPRPGCAGAAREKIGRVWLTWNRWPKHVRWHRGHGRWRRNHANRTADSSLGRFSPRIGPKNAILGRPVDGTTFLLLFRSLTRFALARGSPGAPDRVCDAGGHRGAPAASGVAPRNTLILEGPLSLGTRPIPPSTVSVPSSATQPPPAAGLKGRRNRLTHCATHGNMPPLVRR